MAAVVAEPAAAAPAAEAPSELRAEAASGSARTSAGASEHRSPSLRLRLRGGCETPALSASPEAAIVEEVCGAVFDGFSLAPEDSLAEAVARLEAAQRHARLGVGGDLTAESVRLAAVEEAAARLAVADARLASEATDEALREVALAADLSEREDIQALCLHVSAKALFVRGDLEEAASRAHAALSAFRDMGHGAGEAAALNALAQMRLATNPQEALKLAQASHALFVALGDDRRAAAAQRTTMGAHLALGDTVEALRIAQQALARFQSSGDRRGEAATMVLIAEVYATKGGSADEVLRWSHEAAELFRAEGDRRNEAAARYTIAKVYLERAAGEADLEPCRRAAERACSLFRALADGEREVTLASMIHAVHFLRGNPDEALSSARGTLRVMEAAGDRPAIAAALRELVHVHLTREEPREARRVANEARALCQELGRWRDEVALLSCAACAHFLEQDPDRGIEAASEMLSILRRHGQRAEEAELLVDIAELQLARRMPSRALRVAEPALAVLREVGTAEATRRCMEVIVAAKRMREVLKSAVQSAREAVAHYQEYGNREGLYVGARLVYDARLGVDGSLRPLEAGRPSDAAVVIHQPLACGWLPAGRRPRLGVRRPGAGAGGGVGGRWSLAEAGVVLKRPHAPAAGDGDGSALAVAVGTATARAEGGRRPRAVPAWLDEDV